MTALQDRHPELSKTEAIELAVRTYLALQRRGSVAASGRIAGDRGRLSRSPADPHVRILADIWVDYVRQGHKGWAFDLDRVLAEGSAVMCGPVAAELLAGTAGDDQVGLWGLLQSLPWAPLGPLQWRRVGETAAALRLAGHSLPLTDIEMAAAAVDANATLWARDPDFDRIARIARVLPGLHVADTSA
ncbi:MAG: hypothetical protein ACRDVM_01305 [Acidimicrobiia bacterium]